MELRDRCSEAELGSKWFFEKGSIESRFENVCKKKSEADFIGLSIDLYDGKNLFQILSYLSSVPWLELEAKNRREILTDEELKPISKI